MHKVNFNERVLNALKESGVPSMKAGIEKELLHYDIFFALDKAGLLNDLVFQGGTSLRLCRGSSRLSEDLDFAGGTSFCAADFLQIRDCLEQFIGDKYGLKVSVKEPKDIKSSTIKEAVSVSKWQVGIETAPEHSDIPRQKIKIEIANIPAYTRELIQLDANYSFFKGMTMPMVNTETTDEIMADKLLAFPVVTSHIRYRDIWDLAWLAQKGTKPDIQLVTHKINDYTVNNYTELLDQAIIKLPDIIDSPEMISTMRRFVDPETMGKTLHKEAFRLYLKNTVGGLLAETKKRLSPGNDEDEHFEFRM